MPGGAEKNPELQQVLRVVSRLLEPKYPEAPDDFRDVRVIACFRHPFVFSCCICQSVDLYRLLDNVCRAFNGHGGDSSACACLCSSGELWLDLACRLRPCACCLCVPELRTAPALELVSCFLRRFPSQSFLFRLPRLQHRNVPGRSERLNRR